MMVNVEDNKSQFEELNRSNENLKEVSKQENEVFNLADVTYENDKPKYKDSSNQTDNSIPDGISSSKNEFNNETAFSSQLRGLRSSTDMDVSKPDAVHPFFKGYPNRTRSVGTSTEEDRSSLAYCRPCKTYLSNTFTVIEDHFSSNYHKPDYNCIYCKGRVYIYSCNDENVLYHRCDSVESTSTSSELNNNKNDDNEKRKTKKVRIF